MPFLGTLIKSALSPTGHVSEFQMLYDKLKNTSVSIDGLIHVAIFQSFIGAILLFLLLLALRNKFRLK